MNWSDKIALITGSTSGIGLAIVQELNRRGSTVIVSSEQDNFEIGQQFTNPDKIHYQQADISQKSDILQLKDFIENKFGRLDYLVANAGILPQPSSIDNITDENIDRTVNVNLKGTFYTLRELGGLVQRTSLAGAIVTMTSVDGIIGEPYGVIYSATKAGIISLTKSFARQFKDPLVRVNAVAPGLIDTPLSASTGEDPS